MLVRLSGLIAATVALTLVVLVTPAPARAIVSAGDRARDVSWTFQGGATATKAERRRVDLRGVTARRKKAIIRVRLEVTDWVYACTNGVPCEGNSTAFSADFRPRKQSRRVSVYGARWPSDSETRVDVFRADGSSYTRCSSGQVKMRTSAKRDHVLLIAPRRCFPKGWRVRTVMGWSAYSHNADVDGVHQYKNGQDYTQPADVNWVPNPA